MPGLDEVRLRRIDDGALRGGHTNVLLQSGRYGGPRATLLGATGLRARPRVHPERRRRYGALSAALRDDGGGRPMPARLDLQTTDEPSRPCGDPRVVRMTDTRKAGPHRGAVTASSTAPTMPTRPSLISS
jgi:hypothetical protein